MHRRDFLATGVAALFTAGASPKAGEKLAAAARQQVGVTTSYDPAYVRIPYPNGDIPRSKGICADVILRAGRDAMHMDLQQLVHEDMAAHFAAYPSRQHWGLTHPDTNIDHRRVLNLETYFTRLRARLFTPDRYKTAGDAFPQPLQPGDILSWRLDGRLPHIGMVYSVGLLRTTVIHNWGNGAEESSIHSFGPHTAIGHFRWVA